VRGLVRLFSPTAVVMGWPQGEDFKPCSQFLKAYLALCPQEWVRHAGHGCGHSESESERNGRGKDINGSFVVVALLRLMHTLAHRLTSGKRRGQTAPLPTASSCNRRHARPARPPFSFLRSPLQGPPRPFSRLHWALVFSATRFQAASDSLRRHS
jgi:hypothetical protein